jgi:hypothetical protein
MKLNCERIYIAASAVSVDGLLARFNAPKATGGTESRPPALSQAARHGGLRWSRNSSGETHFAAIPGEVSISQHRTYSR